MAKNTGLGGGDTRRTAGTDLTKTSEGLVNRVLSDPALFPDTFVAWLPKALYGNVNFQVLKPQLPVIENPHLVGVTGQIAFGGTWVNFGGANEPARYWIDYMGIVHLGGIVKSGVIGTGNPIFTLPAGYRPEYAHLFAVPSNGAFGVCTVNPISGTVEATVGNNTYFSLSGITFRQYA